MSEQLDLLSAVELPVRRRISAQDAVRPAGCTADHQFPEACAYAASGYEPECAGCRWHDADFAVFEQACMDGARERDQAEARGLIPAALQGKKRAKKKPSVRALITSD